MLSGTVRAVLMSCVTIRNVASVWLVEVDDELVEVRGAHRVQAGVGLVEEDDLRVEHERPGQTGPLAHAAGDLAGQLLLGADRPTMSSFSSTIAPDLRLGLAGVLAQREGHVVVDVHRAEQRAVLEQHAEELAHLVQVRSRSRGRSPSRSRSSRGRAGAARPAS